MKFTRIPVATVVGMVADGMKNEEILRAYPDLETDDIREALRSQDVRCQMSDVRCQKAGSLVASKCSRELDKG